MSETYEMTPVEKYDFIRRNKKTISFDGYYNHVHIDSAARTITIDVDDDYEFIEEGNEYKRLRNFDSPEQRLIDAIFRPHLIDDDGKRIGTPENEDDYRFFPIVSHKDITKKFKGDYVYRDVFHLNAHYGENNRTLFNPFAGLLITFPIGEGLIDFCFSMFGASPEDLLNGALKNLEYNNISKEITTPKARNKDELRDLECEYMRRSVVALDPYMYRSLYSAIFPPELEEISETSLKYYIFYLNELKREMRNRLKFVFDDAFYPEELSGLRAHERFAMYAQKYGVPRSFKREESFWITSRMDKTSLECSRLPMDVILKKLRSNTPSMEQSPLEKEIELAPGKVGVYHSVPLFMSVAYKCCTIHDMLELEFTKMLEYDIKIHRCKNCGRYFIVKGNYNAEYCDRIREGETHTCQQIAAQKKYEEKLQNDKAVSVFRKYYKRYYARKQVGTIKPDKFRLWNYQACEKRDMCQRGEITLDEFEEWLEGSFKNRNNK
ncbi:MAG: hypothetical protein IK990_00960 [Ruminiclostridium sp.]|nr:hypothetical protein [Ruminiclostridium sp.]